MARAGRSSDRRRRPCPQPHGGEDVPPEAARRWRSGRGCLLVGILILLVGGVGGGALLISAGALEWIKPLENVTFDTIDQYANGRQVTLTGELSLSDSTICYDNGKHCPAELVDAEDATVGAGHPRKMFIYFDRSGLVAGPKVRLTSGGLVETGAVVRVTGRVCRTAAEPPETCVSVDQIESAGGPIAEASPGPSASAPTPTVTPRPVPTEDDLVAACYGTPVPGAAPYAGKVHPVVVVYISGVFDAYAINKKWLDGKWTSPIQLVVCAPSGDEARVRVGSCGRWTRTDGVKGELVRYRYKARIRVVVAATGKTLQSKTLLGSVPPCGGSKSKYSSLDLSVKPPWKIFGFEVTDKAVNKYATAVSTQKVK